MDIQTADEDLDTLEELYHHYHHQVKQEMVCRATPLGEPQTVSETENTGIEYSKHDMLSRFTISNEDIEPCDKDVDVDRETCGSSTNTVESPQDILLTKISDIGEKVHKMPEKIYNQTKFTYACQDSHR